MLESKAKMSFQEVKICLLGDAGVGKSSLVERFVKNTFTQHIDSTIGAAFMSKTLIINNVTYRFNVWDTAGQENYRALAPLYYRHAAACIIVYDITSLKSFQSLKSWIRELRTHISPILALAGNKCDLKDKREVASKDVKEYADSIGAIFIETSAQYAINVTQLFISIASKLPKSDQAKTSPDVQRITLTNNPSNQNLESKCCSGSSQANSSNKSRSLHY